LEPEFEVVTAANGRQALAEIAKRRPDLIITDRMMPEMSGSELVERIRAVPVLAGVPIIMLTALGGTEDKVGGLQIGADDYLAKPFEAAELVARVKAALRRSRLAGLAATPTGSPSLPPDVKGFIAGLSLTSALQMLNLDRATCDLRVTAGKRVGSLWFVDGEIVAAGEGTITGAAALYEITAWPNAAIELRAPSPPVGSPIREPVSRIVMETLRRQDARAAAASRPA
jgi:CheY-like chemotaxis protein